MSGFNCVYSSMASYPCTLWMESLSMDGSTDIRDEVKGLYDAFFLQIEVNRS